MTGSRALNVARNLYWALEGGIDYTFYYHIWDQLCDVREFEPFFQDPAIMYHHWNEIPHRFAFSRWRGKSGRPMTYTGSITWRAPAGWLWSWMKAAC